jgi:hypothetical protein
MALAAVVVDDGGDLLVKRDRLSVCGAEQKNQNGVTVQVW